MATDGAGNLFVADSGNDTIRKVVIDTGVVTTLAGFAQSPGSADGTGADARFYDPRGVVSDGEGHLLVADAENEAIRKVIIDTGVVTTVAGSAPSPGNADGTGTAAQFHSPQGLASDGVGNLFVADRDNEVIRKLVIATGAVTAVAGAVGARGNADGTGTKALFYSPVGVASDGAGNLFVADRDNEVIRKLIITTGVITTVAGAAGQSGAVDGSGTAARFSSPVGVASDGAGNLFITESLNNTVRRMVMANGTVTTVAGAAGQLGSVDGTGGDARFDYPWGIASDGMGNLFVADSENQTIRKVVIATGAVTTLAGSAGISGSADGTGPSARFSYPSGIASDGAGSLFVADTGNSTVRKIVIATGAVTTVVGVPNRIGVLPGPLPANLGSPGAVVFAPPRTLFIADTNENSILVAKL